MADYSAIGLVLSPISLLSHKLRDHAPQSFHSPRQAAFFIPAFDLSLNLLLFAYIIIVSFVFQKRVAPNL
jgi:hypothetical protein